MDTKKLLYGSGALLVAIILWAIFTVPKPPSAEEVAKDAKKFMEYGNQTIFEEKEGKRVWEIKTVKSKVEIATQNAEFENITGRFYAKDGRVLEVSAPHGTFIDKTKEVVLEGNIKASISDGSLLTSEKLIWDGQKQILTAIGKARVSKDDFIAEGDKIEGYDAFEEFKITGHGHITRKDGKRGQNNDE